VFYYLKLNELIPWSYLVPNDINMVKTPK
jgi:hypothetical protein